MDTQPRPRDSVQKYAYVSRITRAILQMIVGYRNKQTAQFAVGRKVKAFTGFEQAARLKLDRLDAAIALADLAALPGNRFQTLKDERKEDVLGRRSNRAGSVPSGLAGCQLD